MQSLKNKIGEVEFRKKLAIQFEGKETLYPGEPTEKEYVKIVYQRIKDYTAYFKYLQQKHVPFGPYLEIGGGVGQGAMLLENKFEASGFTSDISYETVLLSQKYLKSLRYKKMPLRICCDAYNLPFQTNSLPFVFTFQTLHHFPDPLPVLKEIKRVLAPNGYFYINEEPIAQAINLNIWRRDRNLKWFEKILKMLIVLHFVSRIGKTEIEHDILEETFPLTVWEKALNIFYHVETNITVFPLGPRSKRMKNNHSGWLTPFFLKRVILDILGGGIEALCQKDSTGKKKKYTSLLDLLACPNCSHKPKLHVDTTKNKLTCSICKSVFKKRNGIFLLFSKHQEKNLYPSKN